MQRYLPLITLLVLYLTTEPTPVYKGCDILSHFTFHFNHANIWHLLANSSCVLAVRKIRWVESYAIAVACSFLVIEPTVGLSGILFSAIGLNLGKRSFTKGLFRCFVTAFLIGLLPGVSLVYHLVTLLAGYAYGWCAESIRLYRRSFPS